MLSSSILATYKGENPQPTGIVSHPYPRPRVNHHIILCVKTRYYFTGWGCQNSGYQSYASAETRPHACVMPATIASKNNGNGPYAQTGKEGCEGLWPSPVNVIRRYFIRLGDPRRKIIVLGVIILCWDREGRYPIKEKEKKREGKEKLKEKEGERWRRRMNLKKIVGDFL